MTDMRRELHKQIRELLQDVESVKDLLEAMNAKEENLIRRLTWLENNYQEQQMQLDSMLRRLLNDVPVAPWED